MIINCYQNYEYVINENVSTIYKIIKKINYTNFDEKRLFELGIQGILQASRDFDIRYNVDFSKFCVKYIIINIKNKVI